VKASYPNVVLWASFHWGNMKASGDYSAFTDFASAVDVFAITSYPYDAGILWDGKSGMPPDYYSSIRTQLPTQRLAISEIGFPAIPRYGGASMSYGIYADSANPPIEPFEEERQARFYANLPGWIQGLDMEWISLGIIYDITQFGIPTNFVGLFYLDGKVKRSFEVAKDLVFT
jgi:hypothetical protein